MPVAVIRVLNAVALVAPNGKSLVTTRWRRDAFEDNLRPSRGVFLDVLDPSSMSWPSVGHQLVGAQMSEDFLLHRLYLTAALVMGFGCLAMTAAIISGDTDYLRRLSDAFLYAFGVGVAALFGYTIITSIQEDQRD